MHIKRYICFILAMVMLIGLASCIKDDSETPAVTTESTVEALPELALDGYEVVRSDDASESEVKMYAEFYAALRELGGAELSIADDFLKSGESADPNALEILCGPTNRPETAEALAALPGYYDFSVTQIGKKLCAVANTDEGIKEALDYLLKNSKLIDGKLHYTGGRYVGRREYPLASATINGQPISAYTIVYADGNGRSESAAEALSMLLAKQTGVRPRVVSDKQTETENEILIGKVSRAAAVDPETLGENSYRIAIVGSKLLLAASAPVGYSTVEERMVALMSENKLTDGLSETGNFTVKGLDGARVMFVGNSFLYYGYCTTTKNKIVLGDKGYFQQVAEAMGDDVDVTSVTYGGKGLKALYDILIDNYPNYYGKGGTMDHFYEQDFVILQQEGSNASSTEEYAKKIMELFPPETKFAFFIHHHNAQNNHTNVLNAAKKLRDENGVIYIPEGHMVYDIWKGKTEVPGATLSYNKNSFVVNHSDTHHPNYLNGYLTALSCYYALTGNSIVDCPHDFVRTTMEYYTKAESNYDEILASDADMRGLKVLVEQYVEDYR